MLRSQKKYEVTILLSSYTAKIIDSEVLNKLQHNSLAITNYKLDGLKYGFIELDQNFKYLKGNEKETETGHISIGAYSVEGKSFFDYSEFDDKFAEFVEIEFRCFECEILLGI